MNFEKILLDLFKWLGGGGVAFFGLWLTKQKNSSENKFNIIHDLQDENKRKDERLDKQDEKIQFLTEQMDDMRIEMFAIQSDKHKSEVRNVELESEKNRLVRENSELVIQIQVIEQEKSDLINQLDTEIDKVREEFNKRMDRLIRENEELRTQIAKLSKNNND